MKNKFLLIFLGITLLVATPLMVAALPMPVVEDGAEDEQLEFPDFGEMTVDQTVSWMVAAVYGVLQVFIPGISIFDLFKRMFRLKDFWAHIMVVGVAVGVGLLAMYLGGGLGFKTFNLETILGFVFSLYAASQLAYTGLKTRTPG